MRWGKELRFFGVLALLLPASAFEVWIRGDPGPIFIMTVFSYVCFGLIYGIYGLVLLYRRLKPVRGEGRRTQLRWFALQIGASLAVGAMFHDQPGWGFLAFFMMLAVTRLATAFLVAPPRQDAGGDRGRGRAPRLHEAQPAQLRERLPVR